MQGIEGGVLVLLADQQGDVKVARCDEYDFNTYTGQCGQRTGGDAAAGDHLLTKEVDLAVAAGDQLKAGVAMPDDVHRCTSIIEFFLYFTSAPCGCQSPRWKMRALFPGGKCVKIRRYEYYHDF